MECDLPVVTQGKTLDEVVENIKEAIELHLEELGTSPNFAVLINKCIRSRPNIK